jgi:hypothetical protein
VTANGSLHLLVATLIAASVIACDSADPAEDLVDEAASPAGPTTGSTISPTPEFTLVPVSNVTETGIRVVMAVDFPADPDATPGSGYLACETDASVYTQYGKVVEVLAAPDFFEATVGETIYLPDGTETDPSDPTLGSAEVYRDDDGRLILGWRHCEDAYPSATPQ